MRAVTYPAYSTDLNTLVVGRAAQAQGGAERSADRGEGGRVNPVDWKLMAGGLDGLMDSVFPVDPGLGRGRRGRRRRTGYSGARRRGRGDRVRPQGDRQRRHLRRVRGRAGVRGDAQALDLSFEQAAGLPLAGGTALRTLDALRCPRETKC